MVKKGSIFGRIADRFRGGAGVRVDDKGRAAERSADPARARVNRVEPAGDRAGPLPVAGVAAESATTRRLSEREEAMVALGGHFQELATLLRGVHARMDGQLVRLGDTVAALHDLPVLSGQQLEVLRGLAAHMERQNALGEQVARTLQPLPNLLQSVEQALERAARTDERTATTMREFQTTMDRIQSAMSSMVQHSEQQARATQRLVEQREDTVQSLAAGIENVQREAMRELRDTADVSLQSLRRTHEDQSNRLQRVVEAHAGWNKAVLVVLGVVALGVLAILAMLVVR